MFTVISDLALIGIMIEGFDPAEDTILNENNFQFISLSKLKLLPSRIDLAAYLETIAVIIKDWTVTIRQSVAGENNFLQFLDFFRKIL